MTFSIVARDPATGDLGIAIASKALAVGAVAPFARAGVGAISTQAMPNVAYGPDGLARLGGGRGPGGRPRRADRGRLPGLTAPGRDRGRPRPRCRLPVPEAGRHCRPGWIGRATDVVERGQGGGGRHPGSGGRRPDHPGRLPHPPARPRGADREGDRPAARLHELSQAGRRAGRGALRPRLHGVRPAGAPPRAGPGATGSPRQPQGRGGRRVRRPGDEHRERAGR